MKLRREGDIGSRVGVRLVRARQVSYTRVSSLGVALVGRVCLGCVVCGEETVAETSTCIRPWGTLDSSAVASTAVIDTFFRLLY